MQENLKVIGYIHVIIYHHDTAFSFFLYFRAGLDGYEIMCRYLPVCLSGTALLLRIRRLADREEKAEDGTAVKVCPVPCLEVTMVDGRQGTGIIQADT